MYYWIALVSQHSSHCHSFWANIPLNRSFCFSLAHSCSLWLTHRLTLAPNPALAGSLRGSLWLFMALSGSRSGLSATLWLIFALLFCFYRSCSAQKLRWRTFSQSVLIENMFCTSFVVCYELQICFHAIWNSSAYQFLTWCQNAGASANWSQLWPSHRPRKPWTLPF